LRHLPGGTCILVEVKLGLLNFNLQEGILNGEGIFLEGMCVLVEGKLDVLYLVLQGSPLMHSRQQCYREAHPQPYSGGVWGIFACGGIESSWRGSVVPSEREVKLRELRGFDVLVMLFEITSMHFDVRRR